MSVNWNDKLMLAIFSSSNLKSAEDAINKGADVNTEDNHKWTPLLKTFYYHRKPHSFSMFKMLVARGANVNRVCHDDDDWGKGNTLLALSVRENLIEYAKYLISLRANVCKVGKGGKTPLSWAVANKNIEMIELLLDHGAHFTIPTAFLEAIELNNLEIVKKLISKEANVNFLYQNGCTPLTKALQNYTNDISLNIIKTLIIEGADVNLMDKTGYTPLAKALEEGDIDVVKELVENGADVNTPDLSGNHPLIKSVRTGRFDIARIFVEKGANLDKPDADKNFPLTKSTELGNLELVKTLIEKGANLKVTDKLGRSPFMIALQEDHLEIVKYFVEQGKFVNQILRKDETALSIAAANLNYQMFQFLVQSGADVKLAKKEIQKVADEDDNFDAFVKNNFVGKKVDATKSLGSNGQEDAV